MGATPTHLSKLDRVQATMERIGGSRAEPLAARRGAALVALTLLRGSTQVHELVSCVDGLGSFFRVVGSNPTVEAFFKFTFSASAAG